MNEKMIMYYLGLDIGGTKIAAVVMDVNGTELKRFRTNTVKTTYNSFLDNLIEFILNIYQDKCKYAIGIALPGSISPLSGKIKNSNILVLNGKDLKSDLESRLQVPVIIENDGNCFALSEACDGAGMGMNYVYGVTLGTGCGGGLAIHQRTFTGAYGNAGETGHITLPGYDEEYDGSPVRCYCGKLNCVESFVSGTALSERFGLYNGAKNSAPEIIALAYNNDPRALQIIAKFRNQLARLLATIVNVIDPHIIVLGGGLSNEPLITNNISHEVGNYVFTDKFCTPIVTAKHGDSSGMRGAAWLAVRNDSLSNHG